MKTKLLTVIFFSLVEGNIFAQGPFCNGGGCTNLNVPYPSGTFSTTSSSWTTVSTTINGGNYAIYNVTSGNSYEWSTCGDFGGSQGWDAQLTLMDMSNNILCFDDNCGRANCPYAPYLGWTATYTGQVKLLVSVYNTGSCQNNGPSSPWSTLVWRQSATGQVCTNWSIISVNPQSVPSSGGGYSVDVYANGTGCQYTTTINAPESSWLHWNTVGSNTYQVDNNSGGTRTGIIWINDYNDGINNVTSLTVNQDAASSPAISLSGNLSFGNVQVGSSSSQILTITNTGNATLSVSSISYPSGFTGSWSGNISAGNNQNVTVTFSPTSATSYGGTIIVYSNSTSGTNTIACSGTGISIPAPVISLSGNMSFGSVQVGNSSPKTLTISNTGNAILNVSSISYPSGFSGNWNNGNIGAGSSQSVTVTFSPTSAISYGGTITVYSNASSGNNTISCSGTGTTVPAAIINLTGNLSFGNIQVGNSSQKTLTITNTGNATLNVTGINYPTAFTGSWSGSITAGNSQYVTVTFSPTSATSYGGTIIVYSNSSGGSNTISCSGIGTGNTSTPDLTISFPSVNITDLIPLASTQITYTIINNGNGTAGNSITSFFLSTNNIFNAGIDTWIKDDNVLSIAATGSITHTISVTIPFNTPPGIWYIIIVADAPDDVTESDPTNNVSFVSVNINTSISCTANTFPFGDGTFPCDVAGDPWGMIKYQCVSYVAWKVNEFFGETSTTLSTSQYPFNNFMFGQSSAPDCYTGGNYKLGNACHWADVLESQGVVVDNTPAVGSIAHWQSGMNGAGVNGHVAYVSSVSGSVICITEYNWGSNYKCKFNYRQIDMTSNPNRPERFIHVEAGGLGSASNTKDMSVLESSIIIYPNPSSGIFTLELSSPNESANAQIRVLNMLGEVIYEDQVKNLAKKEIYLKNIPTGIYFLQVQQVTNVYNKKISIQK